MKTLVKSLLPKPLYEFLRERRRVLSEQRYFSQSLTQIKSGSYEILAPENHILPEIFKSNTQPYRDLCVGISAKYISAKYPQGTMIDIGANIGDIAAIIATYAQNKLILVEASDYFFDILYQIDMTLHKIEGGNQELCIAYGGSDETRDRRER